MSKQIKHLFQIKLDQQFGENQYILRSKYTNNSTFVDIKHICGLTFTVKPVDMTRKDRPLKCPCSRRKNTNRTTESHNLEAKQWRGSEFSCIEYNGTRDVDNIYHHSVCNQTFESSMNNFKLSKSCPVCNLTISSKVKDNDRFQSDLNKEFGYKIYTLLTNYINNESPIKVKHVCGKTFDVKQARNLLSGIAKCPCLHVYNTSRNIKSHNKEIEYIKGKDWCCVEFKGSSTLDINIYLHKKCGTETHKSWPWFKATLHCEQCVDNKFHNKNRLTKEQVQNNLNTEFSFKEYEIIGNFLSFSKHKTLLKHECNHEYEAVLANLFKGHSLCPKCYPHKCSIKQMIVQNKIHLYQGYENKSIKYLLTVTKYENILNCHSHKLPRFEYNFNNKRSTYYPDFYIPKMNLIVETKSFATFGLIDELNEMFGAQLFKRNQAKAKEVLRKGYFFSLHLWHNDKMVILPSNWMNLTQEQVKLHINNLYSHPVFV